MAVGSLVSTGIRDGAEAISDIGRFIFLSQRETSSILGKTADCDRMYVLFIVGTRFAGCRAIQVLDYSDTSS